MTQSHTKTPWRVRDSGRSWIDITQEMSKFEIAHIKALTHNRKEYEANAAFIVKAVNCHDELMDALENAIDMLRFHCQPSNAMAGEYMDALNQADAALAAAKGDA